MAVTFSIPHILIAALLAVSVMLNAPLVVGGVTAIEAGKYRIAWTRYGWSYQYDWQHAGTMKSEIGPDGIGRMVQISTEKHGWWPWYKRT
jgi:hypothetical protein